MTMFVSGYQELQVYQLAFEQAGQIYQLAQNFPKAEAASLTNPLVTSSRSICTQIAKAWGQQQNRRQFLTHLREAEVAASEVQTWLAFAMQCTYLDQQTGQTLIDEYRFITEIINGLIKSFSI